MTTPQAEKAHRFRALHDPAHPLALANAWDVASAVVAAAAGAPAVATTSAGVAWSLGLPDGDRLDRARALDVVARIVAAVDVPVTADVEGGFGSTAAEVGETVAQVIAAGVVGINIEDADRDPAVLAERVVAARRAAARAGVPLFVNARTDVYLRGLGAPESRLDETVARAHRYLDAGADGIFVPGVVDPATIAALAARIPAPLNVLVGAGTPSVPELGGLGAARVSLGSDVALAGLALVRAATRELLATGTYDSVADRLLHGDVNALLAAAVAPASGAGRD